MRPSPPRAEAFDAAFEAAIAAHRAGRYGEAVQRYEALRLDAKDEPQFLYLLGAAYAELNRFTESTEALLSALKVRPGHLPTLEMLGSVFARDGAPGKAVPYFEEANRLSGGSAEALSRLAHAQRLAGQYSESAETYHRLLAQHPAHRQALVGLAICRAGLGDLSGAEALLRECLRVHPNYPAAHVTFASVLGQGERFAEAEALLRAFLASNPSHTEARRTLGTAVHKQGRLPEAESIYRDVLHAQFDDQTALQLAEALIDMSRLDEAETLLSDLSRRRYNPSAVLTDLGRIEELRGDLDRAIALHTEALAQDPGNENALVNRGSANRFNGAFEGALADYDAALALRPNFAPAAANRGLTLLTLGRLSEAWPHYRSRIKALPGAIDLSGGKPWDGTRLTGKRVLVWLEYGLGDEILFANLLPELIEETSHCTIVCSPRLRALFSRSFNRARVIAFGEPIEGEFDVRLPLTDAAQLFRPHLNAFPGHHGYLAADGVLSSSLRRQYLQGKDTPLVGISWRSASGVSGRFKSVDLSEWVEVLRIPGIRFVSLQYGNCADEIERAASLAGCDIVEDPGIDSSGDLDRFAAQVAAMDLIVSVSNTTVHVAGALGRPVWVLVPSGPGAHWYWFLNRADSPWYPSARLFRQPARGNWRKPLDEIVTELSSWSSRDVGK